MPVVHEVPAEHRVGDAGREREHGAELDGLHLGPAQQVDDRVPDDRDRGESDQAALEDRAEVLDLAVTVGVVAVGRSAGEHQAAEREHRRHDVDDRLERVGQDRGRPGELVGGVLDGEQPAPDDERDEPRPQAHSLFRIQRYGRFLHELVLLPGVLFTSADGSDTTSRIVRSPRNRLAAGSALALFAIVEILAVTSAIADEADAWRSDWELAQGFAIDIDSEGYRFPTSIAFVPNPGPRPKDPLYFVTELRGALKVVTNDRSVLTFADSFFHLTLPYELPNMRAEIGLGAVCLDPEHGYVFASFAYQDEAGRLHNDIVRFDSTPGTFSVLPSGSRRFTNIFAEFPSSRSHQIGHMSVHDGALYVAVGDALQSSAGRDIDSILGKVLRMSLDGKPLRDNPFYSGARVPKARDYVWAYGLRNPFGLVGAGAELFAAENGPNVDRLVRIERGRDYGYDGSDWSMGTNALAVFSPSVGPAQAAWLPLASEVFPKANRGAFYVAFGGSMTLPPGPGLRGERSIVAVSYDPTSGRLLRGIEPLLRYRGAALQLPAGVAFGPDGLYVAPLFPVREDSSAILRVSYAPEREHPFRIDRDESPAVLLAVHGCNGCHTSYEGQSSIGPSLDPPTLVASVARRVNAAGYAEELRRIDDLTDEPYASTRGARHEVASATGKEKVRLWLKYRIMEPRFDTTVSMMPNQDVSAAQADRLATHLVDLGWKDAEAQLPPRGVFARVRSLFPTPRYRHFVIPLVIGLAVGYAVALRRRRRD